MSSLYKIKNVLFDFPDIDYENKYKFPDIGYDFYTESYDRRRKKMCGNCYITQCEKNSTFQSRRKVKFDHIQKCNVMKKSIEDRMADIKAKYCSLFHKNDPESKAIKQAFPKEISDLKTTLADVNAEINKTYNEMKGHNINPITIKCKPNDILLFENSVVVIWLTLIKQDIPKGIIHEIILYFISSTYGNSVSISPRLRNLYLKL